MFNRNELAKVTNCMLKMLRAARLDSSELITLSHLVNSQFIATEKYYKKLTWLFLLGHFVPQVAQMLISNDANARNFRTTPGAIGIYLCLLSSVAVQVRFAKSEIKGMMDDFNDHFTPRQNKIDAIAIAFSLIYSGIRLAHPSQANLRGQMSHFSEMMALVHTIQASLMLSQGVFYLKLNEDMAKFITLFNNALVDAAPFLVLYVIIAAWFGLILFLMGAKLDDGGNFTDDYDTDFNDYPLVETAGVFALSMLRNSIGDLQPPTYDLWAERFDSHTSTSILMITLTWLMYLMLLLIQVVLGLNFLIAIVS